MTTTPTAILKRRDWQGMAAADAYAGQMIEFVTPPELNHNLNHLVRIVTGPLANCHIWIDHTDLEPEETA